jgi:sucrose-6-phosphate hydrolase SacC (GH32 family)
MSDSNLRADALAVEKIPDLSSWRKIGEMTSSLGTVYDLYESPDQRKVAQVDKNLVIYLIMEDGKLTYMNPRTIDALQRMKEVEEFLSEKVRRPEL